MNKDEKVVPQNETKIDSFKMYPSSDDDYTKVVDGKLHIADFHAYEVEDKD